MNRLLALIGLALAKNAIKEGQDRGGHHVAGETTAQEGRRAGCICR